MDTVDLTFGLELEPGWSAIAEPLDVATSQALGLLLTDATPQQVAVHLAPYETLDVSGHAAGEATIEVRLIVGDDVEGHGLALHFGSSEDAQRMRTRLAAAGLLIATLTVGSIDLATQINAQHGAAGSPAHAEPAPAPAPPPAMLDVKR